MSRHVWFMVLLIACMSCALAQPRQFTVPLLPQGPSLKGDLSDPLWQQAAHLTDFATVWLAISLGIRVLSYRLAGDLTWAYWDSAATAVAAFSYGIALRSSGRLTRKCGPHLRLSGRLWVPSTDEYLGRYGGGVLCYSDAEGNVFAWDPVDNSPIPAQQ